MNFSEHDGRVRCVSWFEDDDGFVSAGWDGKIYVWNIKNNTKPEYFFESKGTNFSCVSKMPKEKTIYAVSTDKSVREISYQFKEEKNEAAVSSIISTEKESKFPIEAKETLRFKTHTNYSQVALLNAGRGIVVSTAEDDRPGQIIIYRKGMERCAEIQAHSLPIERIKLSFDNTVLFTAGKDGSFFIFDIKDPLMKKDKEIPSIQLFDEILTEKAELREIEQVIEILKKDNYQLKQQKYLNEKQKEAKAQEAIQKLMEERDRNKHNAEIQKKQLEQEIKDAESRFNEEYERKSQKNSDELESRRIEYEEKKEQDRLRIKDLSDQMTQKENEIQEQMRKIEEDHRIAMAKLEEDNKREIEKLHKTAEELSQEIKNMDNQYKQIRDDQENMYWNEIDEIKEKNKSELYKVTQEGMEDKSNLITTTDEFNKKKQEKEGYDQNIKEKIGQLQAETTKQQNLKDEIENQKNEISERRRTIEDKDTRIYQLKKKTQELEKFKFVLDYKIKELKRDINPKEADIAKLNEQTTKMNQELNHFKRVNENLALIVDDLKMRQDGLQKEKMDQKAKLDEQISYIKKFNDDLFECMRSLNNYKDLKAAIVGLHKKYVLEEVRTNKGEADIQKEYAANRKYLEKSVNYLRLMITKDSTKHRKEYNNYMKENVTLLQEINDLRKQVKELDMKYRNQKPRGSTMHGNYSMHDDQSRDGQDMPIDGEKMRSLNEQKVIIQQLEDNLAKLEQQNARAASVKGRRLPPIQQKLDNEEAKAEEPEQEDEDEEDPRTQEPEKRLDDFKDDEEANKDEQEEGDDEEDGQNNDE